MAKQTYYTIEKYTVEDNVDTVQGYVGEFSDYHGTYLISDKPIKFQDKVLLDKVYDYLKTVGEARSVEAKYRIIQYKVDFTDVTPKGGS